MSEMIVFGASQAIQGRRMKLENDSSRPLTALNSACWCSSRCRSVSFGAHRFSRVRAIASACLPSMWWLPALSRSV